MFYGAIILRFVGTFVRWMFKGFRGSFKDTLNPLNSNDIIDQASYEFISNIIGFLTIAVICTVLVLNGC
jgi:hypothetical protein